MSGMRGWSGPLQAMAAQPLVRAAVVLAGSGVAFGVFVLVITASARYEESTT
jgi:hypothetical protein